MRRATRRWAMGVAISAVMAGCAVPVAMPAQSPVSASHTDRSGLKAQVLLPDAIPAAIRQATLGPAQTAADAASRRRDIDFFNLHDAPVGLRIGDGEEAAWILSYLGTARERTDLNVELRALYAAGQVGFTMNYSGPVTLGGAHRSTRPNLPRPARQGAEHTPVTFELIFGLPPETVTRAYGAYLGRLSEHLQQRYDARPMAFDDAPIVLAVHHGDALAGFVFSNQGNRLVLGERKYADVQSMAYLDTAGRIVDAYALVGFNAKTTAPTSPPRYRLLDERRFGSLVQFGDL